MNWKSLWDEKASTPNFLTQTGRGESFDLNKFLLYMQDVNNALQLCKADNLLDIGGGSGWVTIWLSPYVNSVTMFDYSELMISKAEELTYGCTNITVFCDNILSMKNVQGTYNKILVGSVLQYLKNMEQVKTAMRNIYNVMEPGGICLFTHNPDLQRKKSHIASMPQTEETLKMENERLWIDFNEIVSAAQDIGFRSCDKRHINPLIWQSTHMFDCVVVK